MQIGVVHNWVNVTTLNLIMVVQFNFVELDIIAKPIITFHTFNMKMTAIYDIFGYRQEYIGNHCRTLLIRSEYC